MNVPPSMAKSLQVIPEGAACNSASSYKAVYIECPIVAV